MTLERGPCHTTSCRVAPAFLRNTEERWIFESPHHGPDGWACAQCNRSVLAQARLHHKSSAVTEASCTKLSWLVGETGSIREHFAGNRNTKSRSHAGHISQMLLKISLCPLLAACIAAVKPP